MQEWILNRLLSGLLKFIPNLSPEVEAKKLWQAQSVKPAPISSPNIPPALARKLVNNWLAFPLEYAEISHRAFLKLPSGSPIFCFSLAEWLRLTSAFDGFIPEVILSADFPLPVPQFTKWKAFPDALEHWSFALDYSFDLYPADSTLEFDYCFWLIVWVCRMMIVVKTIEVASVWLHPKLLPSRAAN